MPKVKSTKNLLSKAQLTAGKVATKTSASKNGKQPRPSNQVSFDVAHTNTMKGKGKAKQEDTSAPSTTPKTVKSSNSPPSIPTSSSFIIVAGSYEKNLYGIEGTFSSSSTTPKLRPIFIFPAHLSCIKAVAASPRGGKWLATGSDDEFVKIWDLKRRKEVGGLSQHVGSITSLTFPTRSHLLSASEDSTISLFRTNDWALLRSLKGHSGRINCVDVHPSGKVALSVGKDKTLKMWDLMRGRGAASLALGVEAEVVRFSASGAHFAVLLPNGVDIYALDMKPISSITHPKRLLDVQFATVQDPSNANKEHEMLLVATEGGNVLCYEVEEAVKIQEVEKLNKEGEGEGDDEETDDEENEEKPKEAIIFAQFGGHSNRVKSISVLRLREPKEPSVIKTLFSSVSSDGKINVHDLSLAFKTEGDEPIQPIASYDTKGSRLVCCTMAESEGGARVVRESAGGVYEVEDDEEGAEGDDDLYGDLEEGEDDQEGLVMDQE